MLKKKVASSLTAPSLGRVSRESSPQMPAAMATQAPVLIPALRTAVPPQAQALAPQPDLALATIIPPLTMREDLSCVTAVKCSSNLLVSVMSFG